MSLSRALTYLAAAMLAVGPALAQTEPATPDATIAPASTSNAWEVCNETSFVLRFASAYLRDERMQTVGWTQIVPGSCAALETPADSPRFLFGESLPIHRGGIREWKGSVELCASETDFTSDATDRCRLKNLDTRDYFAVKPTEARTAFIEPADFGVNADTAGLQRLLQDAGYKITRVDGLSGRRTLRTIAEAKSDLGLDKSASKSALIEALIPAAQDARQQVGLDICNDSESTIFGAIALEEDGSWASRGWWPVAPGQCVKPYDRSLIGTQAHLFALQEAKTAEGTPAPDRRLRSETVTPAPFCIAESRFSALGREDCLSKGYAVANFRPVQTEADGQTVRLTDADFNDPGSDGLRR